MLLLRYEKKVLSLHGLHCLHSLHGLQSAVCMVCSLRFKVTVFTGQCVEYPLNCRVKTVQQSRPLDGVLFLFQLGGNRVDFESVDPVFPFGIQIGRINVKMIWRWKRPFHSSRRRFFQFFFAFVAGGFFRFILVANMLCSQSLLASVARSDDSSLLATFIVFVRSKSSCWSNF